MKTRIPHILLLALATTLASVGCDQNKSGPVEPSAEEPTSATDETTKPAPAPSSGEVLYAVKGPAQSVKVGEPADVKLSIEPSEGFKINKLFDWNFEFHPNDAVTLESNQISSEGVQLEDSGATIPVKVTAESAGDHELNATGNFSVCNDDKCELYRDQEVTFKLQASDG